MPEKPSAPNPAPPKRDSDCPEFIAAMREWRDPNHPVWKVWACGHPRRQRQERQPWQKCIPCENSDTRARRYFAGHVALLLIQVLLGCLWVAEASR